MQFSDPGGYDLSQNVRALGGAFPRYTDSTVTSPGADPQAIESMPITVNSEPSTISSETAFAYCKDENRGNSKERLPVGRQKKSAKIPGTRPVSCKHCRDKKKKVRVSYWDCEALYLCVVAGILSAKHWNNAELP